MKERIEVIEGDITQLRVDAIVNAANEQLARGGGVCGAIHAAAGAALEKECRSLGGCPTGGAKMTKGYNLPAQWVIHAVGPVWRGGGQEKPNCSPNATATAWSWPRNKASKASPFPPSVPASLAIP